jgi:hypothetical protein
VVRHARYVIFQLAEVAVLGHQHAGNLPALGPNPLRHCHLVLLSLARPKFGLAAEPHPVLYPMLVSGGPAMPKSLNAVRVKELVVQTGHRLRTIRKARGLNIADLAKHLQLSQDQVSRIETGQRRQ